MGRRPVASIIARNLLSIELIMLAATSSPILSHSFFKFSTTICLDKQLNFIIFVWKSDQKYSIRLIFGNWGCFSSKPRALYKSHSLVTPAVYLGPNMLNLLSSEKKNFPAVDSVHIGASIFQPFPPLIKGFSCRSAFVTTPIDAISNGLKAYVFIRCCSEVFCQFLNNCLWVSWHLLNKIPGIYRSARLLIIFNEIRCLKCFNYAPDGSKC